MLRNFFFLSFSQFFFLKRIKTMEHVAHFRCFELKTLTKDLYVFKSHALPKGFLTQKGHDVVFVSEKKIIICIDCGNFVVFFRLYQNMETHVSIIDELEDPYIIFKTGPVNRLSQQNERNIFEHLIKWYNNTE